MNGNRFQILSLDGGGIKGVFSAAVLAMIEEDLSVNVSDYFDLIAGTSTGGIIALGLGAGLRPKEIVEFYLKNGPNIFSCPRIRQVLHFVFRKYSRSPLETALKDCFGEMKFGESQKRLIITSFSLSSNDIYLFRTAHCEHLKRDYKVPMVNVAMATSAAPTYFSAYKGIDKMRLIDGGVWANNPVMVAVTEAVSFLKIPLSNVYAASVGTTEAVFKRTNWLDYGGKFVWAGQAPSVIMDGQSISATNQAANLLGSEHFMRIDPKVGNGEFSLDGVHSKDDLLARAAHVSRKLIPEFQRKFLSHSAQKFVPIRQIERP